MSSQSATIPSRKVPKVRQACDCCHARKIRCDGTQPCLNCVSTSLSCTYLAVPKKKGPKGKRIGKSKEALRRPINHPFTASVPQIVAAQKVSPAAQETQKIAISPIQLDILDTNSLDLNEFQPSVLVTREIMEACLEAYFAHKYPITPIMDREELIAIIPNVHLYPEKYALITACLSMIVLSPDIITIPSTNPNFLQTIPSSDFFMSETIRARQLCNHIEAPTLSTVHTSFFLFAALFCQGKDNSAWFYIREAMTTLQLLRLHEESTYADLSPTYGSSARRTFWLLFITERAYALQRHRPLTLQRTIQLPQIAANHPDATILSGFLDLLSLFQNFDDEFLSVWNLSTTQSTASAESLIKLQAILNSALPNVTSRTEIQQADLLVSRQWLKTMVWQLCVSKGLLSSQSNNESMSFHYPVTIARDVVVVARKLDVKAFEANGVGILEKVFDIGCSLADVLMLSRSAETGGIMQVGPKEYLGELVHLLGTVLGGNTKFLQLLAAKTDECLGASIRGSLSSTDEEQSRVREIEDDEELDLATAQLPLPSPTTGTFDFAAPTSAPVTTDFAHSAFDDFLAQYGGHPVSSDDVQIMFGPERPPTSGYVTRQSSSSSYNGGHSMFESQIPAILTKEPSFVDVLSTPSDQSYVYESPTPAAFPRAYEISTPEWEQLAESTNVGYMT